MQSIRSLLSEYTHTQIFSGWSGAEAYYIPGLAAYLKIARVESPSNLQREKEVLEWLEGKLVVPKVLGFDEGGDKRYILLSEVEGNPASEYIAANRGKTALVEEFISRSARAMRKIHDLPVQDCPLPQDIDTKLTGALENIRRGFVDESDFEEENLGRTAMQIYDELVEKKPRAEDLVFTHGDFCLPNYMILDREVSGYIDFDRGGVADRYQDIALFLRSFGFNLGFQMEVADMFCIAYGIDSLDEEKIYYYRLLDELF